MLLVVAFAIVVAGCNEAADESPLEDLQIVGVDFELGSIALTNSGTEDVTTIDLWMAQAGEISEFNIFTIEPRATILFSLRDVGGVDNAGGEIALLDSSRVTDPDAVLDYVAWGDSGHDLIEVAAEAGRWSPDDVVETASDTVFLVRGDPSASGPIAWDVTSDAP
jgi:hypothetical protein